MRRWVKHAELQELVTRALSAEIVLALKTMESAQLPLTVNIKTKLKQKQKQYSFNLFDIGPSTLFYYCDEGKCKGNAEIPDGGKCYISSTGDPSSYAYASLQCVEGLACVPDGAYSHIGTCKAVTTKVGEKTCANGEECPLDSICECNDIVGEMQCIPIPVSKKKSIEAAEKFEKEFDECTEKYESLIEAAFCLASVQEEFYQYIGEEVYPYNSEFRCADPSLISAASSVKVSVIAVFATLLIALFF